MSEENAFGDMELALESIGRAKELARPVYVISGKMTTDRPISGPYFVAWPNGSITASGLGRKRVRRKKGVLSEKS